MRFQYTIYHSPEKLLHLADTLSRAPLSTPTEQSTEQQTELFVESVVEALPAQKDGLERYR